MACYFPLSGWLSSSKNPSGKRSVVFSLNSGLADKPVEVPCGKCSGCRADQALMWSIRAYHESTLHLRNCFLTLTYDDDHLPADGKIIKKHLQDFFRSCRDRGYKLRYIACGEYGEQTRRPHYHAIIFGQDFQFDRQDVDESLYTSPTLSSIWDKGLISIAPVTMSSICYVCGYVNKKIGDEDTFSLSSRRPGIGHNWLKLYHDDLVRTGKVTIEGREYPVPPRYLEWLPEEFEALKAERKRIATSKPGIIRREQARGKQKNREANLKRKREKL